MQFCFPHFSQERKEIWDVVHIPWFSIPANFFLVKCMRFRHVLTRYFENVQRLVTWQLGVIKMTHICGSKDGGNDRNNGFLASILLPSTPIMLAWLHEFSSPPPLGNACHAGYNLKIEGIFRTPSPPKLMMGKWHILAFGGLHPLFQGEGGFAGCSSLFCPWLRSWTK